jgi:molybdopterin-binding protein
MIKKTAERNNYPFFIIYIPAKGIIMSIKSINARNQFHGKIVEIVTGPVVSEVDIETPTGLITSIISTRSIAKLELKTGSEVIAFVKSTDIALAKL